jgi:hypothetical protein
VKALSFLQPWAFAVLYLGKHTENRKRPTKVRGQVVMHISKGWDKAGEDFIWKTWERIKRRGDASDPRAFLYWAAQQRGGFAGVFEITDSQPYGLFHQGDIWAFGPHCYTIKNAKPFDEHGLVIPARGQLGFWNVPETHDYEQLVELWKKIEGVKA